MKLLDIVVHLKTKQVGEIIKINKKSFVVGNILNPKWTDRWLKTEVKLRADK